jgi:hypothetical protein
MAGPLGLPTGLPGSVPDASGATVYTAATSDALSPAYGASASEVESQVATSNDAQLTTYAVIATDALAT